MVKNGSSKTTFIMGIKRQTHWRRIPLCYSTKVKPAKKPAIRNTEKHEGGIFIVFCHIMATHITTVRRFYVLFHSSSLTCLLSRLVGCWFFSEYVVSTFQSFVCYLVISFFFILFPFISVGKLVEKKANRATNERKTIELCVCVVQSKYFKSIIVISVRVVFFVVFIFRSFFILECYLKSVFFSYDFLLNSHLFEWCIVQRTVAEYGDVDLLLIVSLRSFYFFFIEVIFIVVGFFLFVFRDDMWIVWKPCSWTNSPVAHFIWYYWNIREFW